MSFSQAWKDAKPVKADKLKPIKQRQHEEAKPEPKQDKKSGIFDTSNSLFENKKEVRK